MFKQFNTLLCLLLLTLFSCSTSPEKEKSDKLIGVKIYQYDKDFAGLIKEWNEIGINTVFTDETLIKNAEFMKRCK